MRFSGSAIVLTVALALCATSCSVSRQATSSHSEQVKTERVETVEKTDSVIVEQRDTLREVTTITIDRNDRGDTLKLVQITDLTRARSRDNVVAQKVKTEIVRDTVYVEKRDSSLRVSSLGAYGLREDPSARSGQATVSSKLSAVSKVLKWIFWILVAGIVLIIVVKLFGRRSLL